MVADFKDKNLIEKLKQLKTTTMTRRIDIDKRPVALGIKIPRLESCGQLTVETENFVNQPHLEPVLEAFLETRLSKGSDCFDQVFILYYSFDLILIFRVT